MSRYDNAPIGNTCPAINNIIGKMELAKDEAEYIRKHLNADFDDEVTVIISELEAVISDMEQIRDDNSTLRDWGNGLSDEKDELERERDDLLVRIEEVETELTEEREKDN